MQSDVFLKAMIKVALMEFVSSGRAREAGRGAGGHKKSSRFATWSRISSPAAERRRSVLPAAERLQHYGDYRHYTDYDEMLCAEAPDFVDVILPTYLHCGAAVKALERGAHCLCEKPMALSPAECARMTDCGRAQREIPDGRTLPALLARVRLAEALRRKRRIRAARGAYFWRGGLSGP